jgi:hypothetical protein
MQLVAVARPYQKQYDGGRCCRRNPHMPAYMQPSRHRPDDVQDIRDFRTAFGARGHVRLQFCSHICRKSRISIRRYLVRPQMPLELSGGHLSLLSTDCVQ